MLEKIIHCAIIPEHCKGMRLDRALNTMFPEYSRAKLQSWVKTGAVTVNGELQSNKWQVQGGEEVNINAQLEDVNVWEAEDIDLNIVYQDPEMIVVDKPAGLVVHPAAGHAGGTLVNALLHHFPELEKLPRAGIIHRIDKDTSGLLLVARNIKAHNYLTKELQERNISRRYIALCHGEVISGGTVEAPIGRHPTNRLKMAVVDSGKPAVTHYRVLKKYNKYTLLDIKLETGRTHQIRVHMEYVGYPLVGDQLYSRYKNSLLNFGLERQFLHATELKLIHPVSGEEKIFRSSLAVELDNALKLLGNEY